MKRLCGILRCSLKLPTNPADLIEPRALRYVFATVLTVLKNYYLNFRTDKEYLLKPLEADADCNVTPLSCPQVQLQVIIRQLELQNR